MTAEALKGGDEQDENFRKLQGLIAEIFEGKVGADTITPDSTFKEDLGADSLHLIELAEEIEEAFGLDLRDDDEAIATIETVGQLHALIVDKLHGQAAD